MAKTNASIMENQIKTETIVPEEVMQTLVEKSAFNLEERVMYRQLVSVLMNEEKITQRENIRDKLTLEKTRSSSSEDNLTQKENEIVQHEEDIHKLTNIAKQEIFQLQSKKTALEKLNGDIRERYSTRISTLKDNLNKKERVNIRLREETQKWKNVARQLMNNLSSLTKNLSSLKKNNSLLFLKITALEKDNSDMRAKLARNEKKNVTKRAKLANNEKKNVTIHVHKGEGKNQRTISINVK